MSTEPQAELVPARNEHVEKIEGALARFSAVDAGLAALRDRYNGIVFEVTTSKGLDLAKAARAEVREIRIGIEEVRKEAKAPILALGKKLDAEASRIKGELEKIEGPIDDQIKAEENRKEREKQERIAAEVKRVGDIQNRIAAIAALVLDTPGASIEKLDALIARADAAVAEQGSFMEFQAQAATTYTSTRERLVAARQAIVDQQAEAAKLKAEREALAKQRAEQEEREREEREAKAARERIEQADRDAAAAELKRQQDELEEQRKAQAAAEAQRWADLAAREKEIEAREAALRPPPPPAPDPLLDPAQQEPEPSVLTLTGPQPDLPTVMIDPDDMFVSEAPVDLDATGTHMACPEPERVLEYLAAMYAVDMETALGWMRSIDWSAVQLP